MPVNSIDVRWQQRFENYGKALGQLEAAVNLAKQRPLTDLEKQGLIQAFEFTHELAWNVLKDYLTHQGVFNLTGSRDTSREAFQKNLIVDGQAWMDMIKSRNLTSHTYNQQVADDIVNDILSRFTVCFIRLRLTMQDLKTS